MNISIAEQYIFVALQMAVEATLAGPDGVEVLNQALIMALTTGNSHSSGFTESEAKNFTVLRRFVAQSEESDIEFCGTLFECIQADPTTGAEVGERVMSFRSTEFVDDAVRKTCRKFDGRRSNSSVDAITNGESVVVSHIVCAKMTPAISDKIQCVGQFIDNRVGVKFSKANLPSVKLKRPPWASSLSRENRFCLTVVNMLNPEDIKGDKLLLNRVMFRSQ